VSRPPLLRLHADEPIVDSFAGGGGASLGIEWALGRSPDIAINHDAEAIAMHQANHPSTRHFCENVWKVDPREACKARPALAWFSPDCKHFSKAKGGKPVDKNIRGLAWIVILWAKTVRPRVILLENVEEFEDWGPVLDNGRPCPERVGLTFRIWVGKLKALGYRVEWRELVAAEYGAATTRKRLFLVARCDGLPIVWPDRTEEFRVDGRRVAADCIEWSLPTYSIFLTAEEARRYGVKRPLAENTLRRVARGLDKFVINNPRPYIVPYWGGGRDRAHDIDEPLRTLTADPKYSLVTPFLTEHANASSPRSFSAAEPLRTQCAQVKGGHFALVAPTLIQTGYGERPGQAPRVPGLDKPLGTLVGTTKHALVAAFLAKHYGGHETPGSAIGKSFDTVTARDHHALVASSIVKLKGTAQHGQQLDLPLHTVQAGGNHYAQVNAFLLGYYSGDRSGGRGGPLDAPVQTISTRDRVGLVTVHNEPYVIADIGMRMLAPRELFRAQGFPDSYVITPTVNGKPLTKEAQVRCVGNSVCPPIAAALARAQFADQVIEVAA
jgi:DNA (cytosine-5)-methyltransferase 1